MLVTNVINCKKTDKKETVKCCSVQLRHPWIMAVGVGNVASLANMVMLVENYVSLINDP